MNIMAVIIFCPAIIYFVILTIDVLNDYFEKRK